MRYHQPVAKGSTDSRRRAERARTVATPVASIPCGRAGCTSRAYPVRGGWACCLTVKCGWFQSQEGN